MKPFLIAVDGPDGAGKSTLVGGLKARYEALGLQCSVIHAIKHSEPGALYYRDYCDGTLEGDPIREACGMLYSVMDSIHTAIREAEEQGIAVVIFDRCLFSTLAYQVYVNGYYWFEPVLKQCFAQANFPVINTFLLDIDSEVAMQRLTARGNLDVIEQRGVEYQKRIRRAYRQAAYDYRSLMGREMPMVEEPVINVSGHTTETLANMVFAMAQVQFKRHTGASA